MVSTTRQMPKLEPRFFDSVWLGQDSTTGESLIGIHQQVVRARKTRRQIEPHKYNKQLLDVVNAPPWRTRKSATPPLNASTTIAIPVPIKQQRQPGLSAATQTGDNKRAANTGAETPAKAARNDSGPSATARMATSPTHIKRTPLPTPIRERSDAVEEGSTSKQQRTSESTQQIERPTSSEQPTHRMRINAVTVAIKSGDTITTASCEDQQEVQNEKILLEPIVTNTEGLDRKKVIDGMKKEIRQMKQQNVYTEIDESTLTPEQRSNIVEPRWVLRTKGDEVRARIVAKGYTESINDLDDVYASTPLFCTLRTLLTLALGKGWSTRLGDISAAFLHAAAAKEDIIMRPPNNRHILWKINKALYGLRSSPKAWQDHLATLLTTTMGMTRLKSEPNVYRNKEGTAYIMIYVDDLFFLGDQQIIDKLFSDLQQHLQEC